MLRETERTRAIRRAQHDTYAPYYVRQAMRGDYTEMDLFDRLEPYINYGGAVVMLIFVAVFAYWALKW